MNIAIIKNTKVIDAAVFDDYETAKEFFNNGVWANIEADNIAELPDGYGIGDSYTDNKWEKFIPPAVESEPLPEPFDPITALTSENALLKDQITDLQLALCEMYESVISNGTEAST